MVCRCSIPTFSVKILEHEEHCLPGTELGETESDHVPFDQFGAVHTFIFMYPMQRLQYNLNGKNPVLWK